MRVAAIDIGTNSIRSTIVEVPVGGSRKTLDDEKAHTRLGRGVNETGLLSDEAMDETVAVLRRMLQIAAQHDVTHVRAVATAAVRSAGNAQTFRDRIRREFALELEVISEEEEGRLAFFSAAESVGLEGRSAVLDIGGGSVEIVRAADGQIEFITSLPLGAVVLSERYHATDPIDKRDLKRLVKHVRRSLADALDAQVAPVGTLVGSGGTITTLAGIIAARRDPALASVHRYTVRRAEIIHLLAELAGSSARQRAAIKGMPESRVDIILAGTVVVDEAMRALGVNELVVNARGIREGIVIDTVQRERGASAPFDSMQSVREFARRCHADVAHAEQVRTLSLELYDRLAEPLALDAGSRYLLETAALLHDVGYHIAYERHHRHSYHLISYAEIPGFSSRELSMVAAIARYHRGALPKPKHEALRDLDRADRETVVRLAALLRLADGLDRSRGQRVSRMSVEVTGARVTITLEGEGPLDAEAHGGGRKADLFESTFNRRVDVESATGAPTGT